MSRSRKKTPKQGICDCSEKSFKKYWHGLERRIKRNQIKKVLFSLDEDKNDIWFPKKSEEVIEVWAGNKDGKIYLPKWQNNWNNKVLGNWKEFYNKQMRK